MVLYRVPLLYKYPWWTIEGSELLEDADIIVK